jgi:hypothetical protein
METNIDKSKMLDVMGKPLTQSLFLEINYNDQAIYTLKDHDHTHNGKQYPSLKRLFLEADDPTEYTFAITHLLGWKHWQRLCENKVLRRHIDEWREELEVKLRSRGVLQAIKNAEAGGFQSAKWLADRGWDTRGAGRPSKEEVEHEKKVQARINDEYGADILRLQVKQ